MRVVDVYANFNAETISPASFGGRRPAVPAFRAERPGKSIRAKYNLHHDNNDDTVVDNEDNDLNDGW